MSPFRFDENTPERSPSPAISSPRRRPSVERLKQASRVKNSNIFSLEKKDDYDPTSLPIVERPTANRPLSQQFVNNSFTRFDSMRKENSPIRSPQRLGHKRSESEINIPILSPTKEAAKVPLPVSPEKQVASSPSPTKSSMARTSMFGMSPQSSFDPESCTWSDEERVPTPRALHRHNKSVTFHAEPPVINEYEQQTLEPSISVGSREGSWESDEFDHDEYSFDRGSSADLSHHDDSFDEDLENTDKTPVVLPEDWTRMSPDNARADLVNNEDDVFDGASPSPQRPVLGRSESVASDGEARPLPPLPGFMTGQNRRDSGSLAAAAERAAMAARNLPSPPKRASCSKDDIMKMTRDSSLSFHERLELLGGHHEDHERRASHSDEHGAAEELQITNLDTGEKTDVLVRVAEAPVQEEDGSVVTDLADFGDAPPRISRESILRKVRGTKYDFEDEDDDGIDESAFADSPARPTYEELARMDPDQAIPSRENSRETSQSYLHQHPIEIEDGQQEEYEDQVQIKEEPTDDDGIDLSAIPALEEQHFQPPRSPARMDDYDDRQTSVLHHRMRSASAEEDDDESRYSSIEPEGEGTLVYNHVHEQEVVDDGKETLDDAMQLLTVKDYSEALATPTESAKQPNGSGSFMGLPAYLSTGDYDFGMKEYITPSPPTSSHSNAPQQRLDDSNIPDLAPPTALHEPQGGLYIPASSYAEPPAEVSPPDTPASVVHNRSSDVSSLNTQDMQARDDEEVERSELAPEAEAEPELPEIPDVPDIPERRSTIKTGGRLKTRPSVTPAELEAIGQHRRLTSSEHPVPAIPTQYDGADAEGTEDGSVYSSEGTTESGKADSLVDDKPAKRRESRKMRIDIPQLETSQADDLGLGLDAEFDKVIENQKVGPAFHCLPTDRALPPPPLFAHSYASAGAREVYTSGGGTADIDAAVTPFSPQTSGKANLYTRSQKGYLMRQNTKVVVAKRDFSGTSSGTATSNTSSSATATPLSPTASRRSKSSPRKPSAEQYLKTEPWNGKVRRKSVRNASAQKAHLNVPAPPLPGQESAALGVVDEDMATTAAGLDDEAAGPEGAERGRLFVKVVGVKGLDLPMPRNDRIYFQLTLDNGLHCVTTTSLELGKNAPIGQEFELVVLNDLEFQLTLTTKLPPPPAVATPTLSASPTKSVKSQKASGFSRFLTSPKKRAEKERLEREAIEAEERRLQEEANRKRAARQPTAWDLLHELVNNSDGSFARAYVNLKAHERSCFGRQFTVDVPCYNEWALEKDNHVVNSVRSKRGTHHAGPIRKPPYVVGKLELQLLYIPKPKGATDEEMPKSMGSAVREMAKAGEVVEVVHEGCLSQQGGDCTVSLLLLTYDVYLQHVVANILLSTGVAASSASPAPS